MNASGAGPPAGERLARLETQMDQLTDATHNLRAELREHLTWERKLIEKQDSRVAALERNAEATRTHLRWMKAVWVAMQGIVLGWLGAK